MQIVISVEKD